MLEKLTSLSTLYLRTLEASVMYLMNSTKEKGKKSKHLLILILSVSFKLYSKMK